MRTVIISMLVAASAASPAAADWRSSQERIMTVERVSVADLDLTTARGLRQLRRRISTATESACDSYASKDHYEWNLVRRCRDEVTRMVEAQLARIIPRNDDRVAMTVSR